MTKEEVIDLAQLLDDIEQELRTQENRIQAIRFRLKTKYRLAKGEYGLEFP